MSCTYDWESYRKSIFWKERNICVTSLEGLLVLQSGDGEWRLHRTLQHSLACSFHQSAIIWQIFLLLIHLLAAAFPCLLVWPIKTITLSTEVKDNFISHLSLFARKKCYQCWRYLKCLARTHAYRLEKNDAHWCAWRCSGSILLFNANQSKCLPMGYFTSLLQKSSSSTAQNIKQIQ